MKRQRTLTGEISARRKNLDPKRLIGDQYEVQEMASIDRKSGLQAKGKSLIAKAGLGQRFTEKCNDFSLTPEIIIRVSGVRVPPPLPIFSKEFIWIDPSEGCGRAASHVARCCINFL